MHPYEMKSVMAARGHDRVFKLTAGSLYDTVHRLRQEELIWPLETRREGRRPERTVYALTEAGRSRLTSWLGELLSRPMNDVSGFAAGLALLVSLEPEEAVQLLIRRAAALETEIAAADRDLAAVLRPGVVPLRVFKIGAEYSLAMRRAELDWVRSLVRELEDGTLDWPSAPVH